MTQKEGFIKQFKEIISNYITDPIFLYDQDFNVFYKNSAAIELLKELKIKNVEELFDQINIKKSQILKDNMEFSFSIKIDAIKHYFKFVSFKYVINRLSESFIIILTKVSNQVILQKGIRELNKFKDLMIGSISHNLRTHLTSVLNNIYTLKNVIKGSNQKLTYKHLKNSLKLLNLMVCDLLDFGNIIKGQEIELNESFFPLKKVVHEIYSMFKGQLHEKKVRFDVFFNFKDLVNVKMDETRYRQILVNLLTNAAKFTKKGFVIIHIEIIKINSKHFLKSKVIDSGIGIKKNNIDKIFSLFGKIDQCDKEINRHGIGLGLYIANFLAKFLEKGEISIQATNNEYSIKVSSNYGIGSTFEFISSIELESEVSFVPIPQFHANIPELIIERSSSIEKNINSPTKNNEMRRCVSLFENLDKGLNYEKFTEIEEIKEYEEEGLLQKSPKCNKKSLLLVDDDFTIGFAIRSLLSDSFSIIDIATNGLECVQLLVEGKIYDLILMDCNMPIMDGFEATKNIRMLKIQKKIFYSPLIIGISANSAHSYKRICIESGMNYFLEKPFKKKDLEDLLELHDSKKRAKM